MALTQWNSPNKLSDYFPVEKKKHPAVEFNAKQDKQDCCLDSNHFGDLDIIQPAWNSGK